MVSQLATNNQKESRLFNSMHRIFDWQKRQNVCSKKYPSLTLTFIKTQWLHNCHQSANQQELSENDHSKIESTIFVQPFESRWAKNNNLNGFRHFEIRFFPPKLPGCFLPSKLRVKHATFSFLER